MTKRDTVLTRITKATKEKVARLSKETGVSQQKIAEGKADAKTQGDWLRAHVVEITSVEREWRVKLSTESSTPRTLWHPKGAIVELLISIPKRRAA